MNRIAALWLCLSPLIAATETPWTDLLAGDKLDAFTGKTDGWSFAKWSASMPPTRRS